jgi:hypothetical protein
VALLGRPQHGWYATRCPFFRLWSASPPFDTASVHVGISVHTRDGVASRFTACRQNEWIVGTPAVNMHRNCIHIWQDRRCYRNYPPPPPPMFYYTESHVTWNLPTIYYTLSHATWKAVKTTSPLPTAPFETRGRNVTVCPANICCYHSNTFSITEMLSAYYTL